MRVMASSHGSSHMTLSVSGLKLFASAAVGPTAPKLDLVIVRDNCKRVSPPEWFSAKMALSPLKTPGYLATQTSKHSPGVTMPLLNRNAASGENRKFGQRVAMMEYAIALPSMMLDDVSR